MQRPPRGKDEKVDGRSQNRRQASYISNCIHCSTRAMSRGAIVTGAARGIGRAIAIQLAEDGFEIALNDLPSSVQELTDLAGLINLKGRKTVIIAGDISNEDFVQELVEKTVAEFGQLYIMVANAGISPARLTPIVDISLEVWRKITNVNLDGVFLCYRAAARQMLKQGSGGRIIGASSAYGKQGHAFAGPYCTSKFGVRGLTQVLAAELATSNITVNAYAPGFIDTPLVFGNMSEAEEARRRELCIKATPMSRLGSPEDIAGIVSYLASDKASFVTGQSISVNGGLFYD